MNNLLRHPYIKVLCCYLVFFMAGLIPVPDKAWASFISHQPERTYELDPESIKTLQIVLENELIAEKLSELGLSSEEVIHRIEQLSPEERQIVLEELKTVQVGGDAAGFALQAFLVCLLFAPILDSLFGAVGTGIRWVDEWLSDVFNLPE